jgi:hypothetical protein
MPIRVNVAEVCPSLPQGKLARDDDDSTTAGQIKKKRKENNKGEGRFSFTFLQREISPVTTWAACTAVYPEICCKLNN